MWKPQPSTEKDQADLRVEQGKVCVYGILGRRGRKLWWSTKKEWFSEETQRKHVSGVHTSLLCRIKLSESLGCVFNTSSTSLHKRKVFISHFLMSRIRWMRGRFGEWAAPSIFENELMKVRRGLQVSVKTLKTILHHTATHGSHFTDHLRGSPKTPKSFTQTSINARLNAMWRHDSISNIFGDVACGVKPARETG